MADLGSIRTDRTMGRQRAARVRRDVRVIDEALADERLASLAETALHLAAEIIERTGAREAPTPLSNRERAAFAPFGFLSATPISPEDLLRSQPVQDGMSRYSRLMAEAVPIAEAARRMDVDPSRIRHRIREGTLLAVRRSHGRGWLIPAFQITEDGEVPNLARVLAAARRHLSSLSVAWAFELSNDEVDDKSPRDWLISGGDPAPIERIVAGL